MIAPALVALALAQNPAPAPAGPLLRLDAVVLDRDGAPVADVRPQELEVWINGFRIPIHRVTAVTPASAGERTIVLVLDDVAADPTLAARVRDAARRFVDRMAPGDEMSIVTLSGDRAELTDDRSRLVRAVDEYRVRGFPFRPDDAGQQVLRTVTALSRQIAERPEGRKAIVAIGAGWLFDKPLPPPSGAQRDLRPEWLEAMRATASANASFYVIDPTGLGVSPIADSGTTGFARETGGRAFLNTNDINAAVGRILREISTHYLIDVVDPPIGRKEELRGLDIKVLRPGLTVRARRSIGP